MSALVGSETQWRGHTDTAARRRFRLLVLVSLLLHAPLTPLAALVGLVALVGAPPPEDSAAPEQLNAIPVSLLSDDELSRLGGEPQAAEPAKEARAEAEPAEEAHGQMEALAPEPTAEPETKKPPPPPDAGTRAEREEPSDAGVAADAAPAPAASAPVEPSAADGGAGGPESPAGGEPLALAGAASRVADPNANVKLLLFNDKIRGTEVGKRVGGLIARLPQWRSFFGPTDLDPIQHLERIYVAGPQFRVSADVMALIAHNVSEKEMHSAIDAVVHRKPKGRWLDTPVPAARAYADRAERVFILAGPHLVMMVPPQLTDDAIDKAPTVRFPKIGSEAAVVASLKSPWRALIGLNVPFQIPKSIESVLIEVIPASDGGVDIAIQAVDESPDAAQKHAALLQTGINLATQRDVGAVGALLFGGQKLHIIEPIRLRAKGKVIQGTARATPRQVSRILSFAEAWLDSYERRHPPPGSRSPRKQPTGPRKAPPAHARPKAPPTPPRPKAPPAPAPAAGSAR